MTLPDGIFVGLVGAAAPAKVRFGKATWNLVLRLAAWREPGGSVVRGSMRCELPVAENEWNLLKNIVRPYSVVQLEAANSANGVVKLHRIGSSLATDPELERIAAELQAPIELLSPWGILHYSRRHGWYAGSVEWRGERIEIRMCCADPVDSGRVLRIAADLLGAQSDWSELVQALAMNELLPLKNESWLSEGEGPLSADDFKSRLMLETITVDENGAFTFSYAAGDLFWGHFIEITGDVSRGPTGASISG